MGIAADAVYNASNGTITIGGTSLSTIASQYNVSDIGVTGEGGDSYTLTSASYVVTEPPPSSNEVTIRLAGQDLIQVAALLDLNGLESQDGDPLELNLTSSEWDS